MKTALYTTMFPAALPYVKAWSESVARQHDQDFDLWIALDDLKQDQVPVPKAARWVIANQDDSAATIRKNAFRAMVSHYDIVIFTDSDDVLLPNRVTAAKQGLQNADVYGCAMQLIGTDGVTLGLEFNTLCTDWETLLISQNVFGLSNTAYRTEILKRCLDFPPDTVMVDWLMVMQALEAKARLVFDTTPHMLYRQYENNTARVLSPYSETQIIKATELVLGHYQKLVKNSAMQQREADVLQFYRNIADAKLLSGYTKALNALKPVFLWWECVAHPELRELWCRT